MDSVELSAQPENLVTPEKSDHPPASHETARATTIPHLVIEPGRSWVRLNLRDLWQYRELLYFLTWRDVKVRYKQTVLGAVWAIIQPLFTMLIFTFFFGKLAKLPS